MTVSSKHVYEKLVEYNSSKLSLENLLYAIPIQSLVDFAANRAAEIIEFKGDEEEPVTWMDLE